MQLSLFCCGWGMGLLAFNSWSKLVLQKLMKAVGIQRNSWKTSVARLFDSFSIEFLFDIKGKRYILALD